MATLTPTPTAGKAFYDGTSSHRAVDDVSDNKASGVYSHNAEEFSATMCAELISHLLFLNAILDGAAALKVRNESGGSLAAGTLVYVSSYSAAQSRLLIQKADADDFTYAALFVLDTAVANNANGLAYATIEVLALDTSGAGAVGDPVYLSATAGEWTYTAPMGADQARHEVGRVSAKDAVAGKIRFYPGLRCLQRVGTSWLQAQAVTDAKRSPRLVVAMTGSELLTNGECHNTFTNSGAAGSVTLTLPAAPAAGTRYKFLRVAAQDLVINGNGKTLAHGELEGATITLKTQGCCIVEYDDGSGKWHVETATASLDGLA